MRTTIDLPEDLHQVVRQLAHDRRESMSTVVADLTRQALGAPQPDSITIGPRGVPIISVGHPVTAEDVASLEDD